MFFFDTPAYAQAAGGAAGGGDMSSILMQLAPLAVILVIFYFLLIRPQQQRMKSHQEMITNLKRGDTIVTSGGLIGRVRSVDDNEARIELAPNVEVRVIKATIAEVRSKTDPAPANDSKASD